MISFIFIDKSTEDKTVTVVQMETFAKVAELKSFSAAADALGYAQSTVTTQIRQLEEVQIP